MVRAYSAVIERETERVVRSVTNVKRLETVLTRQTSEQMERRRLFDEKKLVGASRWDLPGPPHPSCWHPLAPLRSVALRPLFSLVCLPPPRRPPP
jgi:hypothetical protein